MARLYEYVPSSKKSGFFLLGSNHGKNTTIQVGTIGNRVFEHLDYEAGRQTPAGDRGEKLPSELVDWLWTAQLIFTDSGEDSTDTSLQSVLDLDDESVEFSESDIKQLVEFLQIYDTDEEVDLHAELVDILDVDTLNRYKQTDTGDDPSAKDDRDSSDDDTPESDEQLSSDERDELSAHLSNTIDGSEDSISLENHLPRANNSRSWLWSVRHFLNDSEAFVHRAAIGSEGDPVYNMQTSNISWDLYDLRRSERKADDFLIIINPLSGHSPKQSFRLDESGISDWQSYEDYLGIRQIRELISVVPSVKRTLRTVPGFNSSFSSLFPQPSSRAMLHARSLVNQSLLTASESFATEPGQSKIWGEVVDISPKGWIEIRLQTNRAVTVPLEQFSDNPSVDDWVLLKAATSSDPPTEFDVITVD